MRAIFGSKFEDVSNIQIRHNESVLSAGQTAYREFLPLVTGLSKISDETYVSIPELYSQLRLEPRVAYSKRKVYERYDSGIVVGAGAGEDCIDLVNDDNWDLFDLQDCRMKLKAIGYTAGIAMISVIEDNAGNTIVPVSTEYSPEHISIEIQTIDSLRKVSCDLISIDSEGSALDVLMGAQKTLRRHSPDLLVSIYHNWIEYLHVIPFLYDHGYDLRAVYTSSDMAYQPHLELSIFASKNDVYRIDDTRDLTRKIK